MILIILGSILGYLLPVSYLLKINFQRSLFLIISTIISLEYIFCFFNILKQGSYIILCIGFISLIASLKIIFTNPDYVKKYLTPSLIIPLSITLFFSYLSLFIIPGTFDEWLQWIPHAKIVYYNDGFITKSNSIIHEFYPLGGALFYYYFQYLSEFNDGSLYFSQCLLQMIPLLVLFEEKSWSNWNNVLIKFVAIIGILFIYNVRLGIGGSLYMDHPAAIFLGCSLVFYVNSDRKRKDILCLIPILASLIQFKLGLSPFVYIIILLIFIDQTVIFYNGKNIEIKIINYINYIIPVFILLFVSYLSKLTWEKYIDSEGILIQMSGKEWNWYPKLENIFNLFKNNLNDLQQVHFNYFIDLLTDVKILFTANPIQFIFESTIFKYIFGTSPVLFLVHILILILIYTIFKKKNHLYNEYVFVNLFFVLGYISYLVALLLMFLFHVADPLYNSFYRYVSIYQLMWLIYIFNLLFRIEFKNILNYKKYFNIVSYIIIVFIVIVPLLKLYRDNYTDYRFYRGSYLYESLKPMTSKVKEVTPENSSINIIWQSSFGSERGIILSDLTPRDATNNCWSIGDPYYEGEQWTCKISKSQFLNRVTDYDYLLLGYIDNNFWHNYGSLFHEQEIKDIQPLISYKLCKGEGFNSFVGKSGCKHKEIKSYLFKIIKINKNIHFENVL